MHYFNELDPAAAEWLRQLMEAGLIARGVVDERSIEDIAPDDLRGHRSVHLFAGIGVWSYALRLAGWDDTTPVWTCSCPCQPFSSAGKGGGFGDERHLWPAAFHLIRECRPRVCFGEQVASDDGLAWLDLVQADLEGVGYTVGAVIAPAAGFGAPHGRHRIYWVADAEHPEWRAEHQIDAEAHGRDGLGRGGTAGVVADDKRKRRGRRADEQRPGGEEAAERNEEANQLERCGGVDGLEHTTGDGRKQGRPGTDGRSTPGGCGSGIVGDPGREARPPEQRVKQRGRRSGTRKSSTTSVVDNSGLTGLEGHAGNVGDGHRPGRDGAIETGHAAPAGSVGGVVDADGWLTGNRDVQPGGQYGLQPLGGGSVVELERAAGRRILSKQLAELWRRGPGPVNGFWRDADWQHCREEPEYPEGRWRPVEPGTFPLAHGASSRVVKLRGYGNGLVAQEATAFIQAYLEVKKRGNP